MVRFIASLAAALLVAGCSATNTAPSPTGAASANSDRVGVINTVCPIDGGRVGRSPEASRTRHWSGATIGFCKEECAARFDAMRASQRDLVMNQARANRAP